MHTFNVGFNDGSTWTMQRTATMSRRIVVYAWLVSLVACAGSSGTTGTSGAPSPAVWCDGAPPVCHARIAELAFSEPARLAEARAIAEDGCGHGDGRSCLIRARLEVLDEHADPAGGERWADRGCAMNTARACSHVGALRLARGERTAGRVAFQRACDLEDGGACGVLGMPPLADPGEPNAASGPSAALLARGERLLDAACTNGSGEDCDLLGSLRLASPGADLAAARAAFDRSCAAAWGAGCANLAWMMFEGKGGDADAAAGARSASRGCDLGSAKACGMAAVVAARSGDLALGRRLATRACSLGDALGCELVADDRLRASDQAAGRAALARGCKLLSARACYAEAMLESQSSAGATCAAQAKLDRVCTWDERIGCGQNADCPKAAAAACIAAAEARKTQACASSGSGS